MSTTTPLHLSGAAASDRDTRPGLRRLTAVELRKMVDTRAGFWLPVAVALITVVVAIVASANHSRHEATLVHVFHIVTQPSAFLLPVMGILLICGEWTQRTTLTTFALVPSRRRVIAAKLGASIVVSAVALVVCLACTFLFTALLGHHPGGAGSIGWQVILQGWLYVASQMVMGLAFGAAILMSAPAIVTYLLLPTVWNAVVGGIHSLAGVARWLDASMSLDPLAQHAMSATQWAHALVTFAVWIGIPIAIGARRIGRGDID